MSFLECLLLFVVFVQIIGMVYLYNKVVYRKIKAEMHVFFDRDKLDKIDFVVLPDIEDLLDEKIFLTKIVQHKEET